jgi:hypothetical protein
MGVKSRNQHFPVTLFDIFDSNHVLEVFLMLNLTYTESHMVACVVLCFC